MAELTPFQTVGPFFSIALPFEGGGTLAHAGCRGRPISIEGTVTDGAGAPVTDALIEVWQANRGGRYAHPADDREILLEQGFTGFGRCATGPAGEFSFRTVKPGPVPGYEDTLQAPHINLTIFARGLLNRVVTRVYFPDEAAANADDPLLQSFADERHRATLIAKADGPGFLRFDIHLRGEGETAFLAV